MAKGTPPVKGQKTRKAAGQRNLRSQRDEESRSLLQFEGGMMDKMKMEEEEESEKEEETHCCCGQKKAIMIYAGFLWILGILVIVNCCLIFGNMYFPKYYPIISLFLAIVYLVALIFISIWMCKDSEGNRKLLLWGGWLIFVAIVALLIWNIFFILNYNKKKKEGIKVGTGDDPDDYDEESRGGYILGYCIWGGIILLLDILFICVIYAYLKTFEESEEEEKKEEMMMDEEKMEMMMDDAPGEGAEGGAVERRSNTSRGSSSKRSQQSAKSRQRAPVATPAPPAAAPAPAPVSPQDQEAKEEAVRNLHAAAIKEIDADDTPRNSLKEKFQYEDGVNSTNVLFNEEPQSQPPEPQSIQEPIKRQQTKKNKKNKKQKKQN